MQPCQRKRIQTRNKVMYTNQNCSQMQEEYDQAMAKARKSVRLRMSGELKEAIETYVADHSDQYKSMNDFICQTLEEKIKQD